MQQRELLDGQLNENKSVLEELNLLKDDNQVWLQTQLNNALRYFVYFVAFDHLFYFNNNINQIASYISGVQIVRSSAGETRS